MTKKEKNGAILDHYNVQIPAQILLHPDIDPYCLKVFAYMKFRYQRYVKDGMTFHESNSTISAAISVSRSKVIESINKLVELGFVVRQIRHGAGSEKGNQTNIYIVMDILTPNGQVKWKEKGVKSEVKESPKPHIPAPQNDWYDGEDDPF